MTTTAQATNRTEDAGVSEYYDSDYFEWQRKAVGAFGGWANAPKFSASVKPTDTVVDFGCGGGFLLDNLNCARKIGIEPNPSAAVSVKALGIEHFSSPPEAVAALGEGVADVIVSNNALEHTLNPLQELKNLRPLLKDGGVIRFWVPCEAKSWSYDPTDVNYHLFTWSPQALGNLFNEAGFKVESVKARVTKWPPMYRTVAKLGRPIFNLACAVYGRFERSWFQVEIIARKVQD